MVITPSHVAIGRLFEQNFLFEVPKYQRYYAWDEDQVRDYIKDIKNIRDNSIRGRQIEHFFGGIVCVSKTVEGSTRQQKELIDGQQRITTTMLLIHNIVAAYRKLETSRSLDEVDRQTVTARIKKLREKYFEYQDEIKRRPQTVPKLVLSAADEDYYSGLINGLTVTAERDSHKRIKKASDLLKEFINSELNACSSDSEKMDVLAEIEGDGFQKRTPETNSRKNKNEIDGREQQNMLPGEFPRHEKHGIDRKNKDGLQLKTEGNHSENNRETGAILQRAVDPQQQRSGIKTVTLPPYSAVEKDGGEKQCCKERGQKTRPALCKTAAEKENSPGKEDIAQTA